MRPNPTNIFEERIFVTISSLFENQMIKETPITGIKVIIDGCWILSLKNINDKNIKIIPKKGAKYLSILVECLFFVFISKYASKDPNSSSHILVCKP